jgi:TctA family transporter
VDFFDAVYIGLTMVVEWPAIGYLVLGVFLGMFFGAVPGLSGLVGMAILLPFTFGMEPGSAFAFLLGMYAVTTTADTLASVLLGIPGTAASQATILDGYPMAQRGEAARALGAAYTVSMFGGVMGAIILAVSIPVVRPIILSFSDPEFFALAVLGLTMVGSLSGNSIFKGCASACIGLMLAAVGYAEFGGIPRYWFNMNYLLDGIPIVPYVLGLFALPELLELAVRNTPISRVDKAEVKGGMMDGIRDARKYWWLGLRCTAIGVYVGMLPGLGGSIVDWVAYGHATQSTKDNPQFGKGDIRGVIAPEAANNAMKGGALLPTIAFAIPGSASMAILLGAFMIQGLEPGPEMLTTKLHVSFSLVWTLVIANVLGAGLLLLWGNQVAKVTFVQGHIILPAIILFVFMGAWMGKSSLGDWITLLGFGVLGYIMKQGGWPRPPLVLGLILGKIMETALNLAVQTHGAASFTRPIVMIISVLVVVTVVFAVRGQRRKRRAPPVVAAESDIKIQGVEGSTQMPAVSLPLAFVALVMFCYGYYESIPWKPAPQMFPQAIAIVAVILTLVVIYQDFRGLKQIKSGTAPEGVLRADLRELGRGFYFLTWTLGILLATLVLGQFVSLLLFVVLYLKFWGKFGWRMITIYTALCAAMLYILFNMVVPVLWYEAPFFSFMN